MTGLGPWARFAAGGLALVALAGLGIRYSASLDIAGSPQAALWSMLRFFTIIGNALTGLVLLGAAIGLRRASTPGVLGGVTLLMGLIGIVYVSVLRQTEHLVGEAYVSNIIMHYAVPLLVALYWLALVPKGGLTRLDPLRWAIIPLAYLPYALARGAQDGKYPYPFLDVTKIGWPQMMLNAAIIAAGFLLVGLMLVWIDRKMRREPAQPD